MSKRLYDDRRWRKARAAYLAANQLCVFCTEQGRDTLANTVDHIEPHKGDYDLFWDSENNWQSLCAPCHSSTKKRFEMSGKVIGCDADGNPLGRDW